MFVYDKHPLAGRDTEHPIAEIVEKHFLGYPK